MPYFTFVYILPKLQQRPKGKLYSNSTTRGRRRSSHNLKPLPTSRQAWKFPKTGHRLLPLALLSQRQPPIPLVLINTDPNYLESLSLSSAVTSGIEPLAPMSLAAYVYIVPYFKLQYNLPNNPPCAYRTTLNNSRWHEEKPMVRSAKTNVLTNDSHS